MAEKDRPLGATPSMAPLVIQDADFERLVRFVKNSYGINLAQKRQLITGRLSTAIHRRGYQTFTAFVDHLLKTQDQDELNLLLNKLTTNYTFFMREKAHWDFFRSRIIPDLVQRHRRDKVLSIWSAGCSSGEEPYNITMYLLDYLGAQAKQWDTRLLASDISPQVLAKAEQGIYELPDDLPAGWRQKYFVPDGKGLYQVAPAVRSNVIFKQFNLMDPITFRRKFDVIFCRNVMIYFDQATKDALVQRFYDATLPGGYLLISYAENLSPKTPYHRLATATFQKEGGTHTL